MLRDFKEFAMRGNVIDLAVAFILGAAFTTIVRSLVADIIMPPVGLLLGDVDFVNLFVVLKDGTPIGPYLALSDAKDAGAVTINYGVFILSVVSFLIVAIVLFLLVRWIVRQQRQEEAPAEAPTTKECGFCLSTIAINATRCPACTSDLGAAPTTG